MLETVKMIENFTLLPEGIRITDVLQSLMYDDKETVEKKFGISTDKVNASLALAISCVSKEIGRRECQN
jgi:hypothetical protein